MFDKLNEVLSWLDNGWINEDQFDEWVERRVFRSFAIRCKDLL